jgi:hypothetical protein
VAYEQKPVRRQKALYNNDNDDNPLVYQLVVDSEKVTPTSATIQVNDPDGDSVLAATAMTLSGTLLTYSLDTTTVANFPIKDGYVANIVTTYNAKTYNDKMVFDVTRTLLRLSIAKDQLVALDDGVQGMSIDGDEDLSPIIEAMRDVLQARVESRIFSDGTRTNMSMILDNAGISAVFRYMVLAQLFRAKPESDEGILEGSKAFVYDRMADTLFDQVMSSMFWDTDQDGAEDGDIETEPTVRLVT